jgi:two-component system sensor histidine kinase/response regulator
MTTILVIEDQFPIRENLLELLELEDYTAIGAEDGLAGLQLAQEYLPDLIICDVLMPKLDGFGVLSHLRADPTTAAIPFIFLTASRFLQPTAGAVALSADAYLNKPYTIPDLMDAIRCSLAKGHPDVRLHGRSAYQH